MSKRRKHNDQEKEHYYPSAKFLSDVCYQDYMRLQDRYDKLYEKLNILIAFVGVVLTVAADTLDFGCLTIKVNTLTMGQLLVRIIYFLCATISIIILLYSTFSLLMLLKGKTLSVLKSEDIRNEKLYEKTEDVAALWLIDKYTQCSSSIRPVINEKQQQFDKSLRLVIIGFLFYAIAMLIGKAVI